MAGNMATTGDKCEQTGLYFVSGACGHASERRAQRDELLQYCHICGSPANWTLLREFVADSDNTIEGG
jgi:hypothetical protein